MSGKNPKILNFRNLDFNKLEYYQPHKTNYGSHIGTVSYRLSKNQVMPIFIETPKLRTTSGLVKVDNKYYMEFELDITSEFYDFVSKFDEKNVMQCHFNGRDWFGQQIPFDVIEDYYKSPIKLQRGGKKPTIKVKIPSYRGKILSEIYNVKREQVDVCQVETDDEIVAILTFAGLRFLSQQFIAEWELSKLKLLKSTELQTLPSGYLFSDADNTPVTINSSDDNIESNNQPVEESSIPPTEESSIPPTEESSIPPTEESNDQPIEESNDQPTEESNDQPTEESNYQPTEESNDHSTEESNDQPTEESNYQPTEESNNQPTEESNDQPTEESNDQPTEESNDQPTEESNDQPTEESNDQPTEESNDQFEVDSSEILDNSDEIEQDNNNFPKYTKNEYRFDDFDEEYVDSEYELDDESLNGIESVDFYNNNEEELKEKVEIEYREKMDKMEEARKQMEEFQELQKQKEEEFSKYEKEMKIAKNKYNKVVEC